MSDSNNNGEDNRHHEPILDAKRLLAEFRKADDKESWFLAHKESIYLTLWLIVRHMNQRPAYRKHLMPYVELLLEIGHRIFADNKLKRWTLLFEVAIGTQNDKNRNGLLNTLRGLNILGMIHSVLGNKSQLVDTYHAVKGYADQVKDPRTVIESNLYLINLISLNTDLSIDEDFKSNLVAFSNMNIGDRDIANRILEALLKLNYEEGNHEKHIQSLTYLYHYWATRHCWFEAANTAHSLGLIYYKEGNYEDAESQLEIAVHWFKQLGYKWFYIKALYQLGMARLKLKNVHKAEEDIQIAYFESTFLGHEPLWMCIAHEYAIMRIRKQDYETARAIMAMVCSYYATQGSVFDYTHAHHTAAYIEYKLGNFEHSQKYVNRAFDRVIHFHFAMPTDTTAEKLMWKLNNLNRKLREKTG